MRLSLIVGLYNMRREIPRSLITMSPSYQNVAADQYEIILVDNGSSDRPDPAELAVIAENARYVYVENAPVSPTGAINEAVRQSQGDLVTVVIDGARMFSPGVLSRMFEAFGIFDDPFVYAPSFHLGPQLQNDSAYGGYDQDVEDALLQTVDWQTNGYELFDISNVQAVPERLAQPTFESNCFTVRRSTWDRVGGYHPGFGASTGGGLANWELFARYMQVDEITPVLLVGEATFHQFHGGASTNQPRDHHPIRTWLKEHQQIVGTTYAWPVYEPVLFGQTHAAVTQSLYEHNVQAHISLLRSLSAANEHDAAIAVGRQLCGRFPNDPGKLQLLAEALDHSSRRAEALSAIDEALTIAPTQAELHVTRGVISVGLGQFQEALKSYDQAIELDDLLPEAFFHRAHLALREQRIEDAVADFEQAITLEADPPAHYQNDLDVALAAKDHDGATDHPVAQNNQSNLAEMVDEFASSVNAYYGDQLSPAERGDHARDGSFSVGDLETLRTIIHDAAPGRILIVGGFLGLSTRLCVEATQLSGSSVIAIDPNLRHRVFSSPLDHARTFVRSDRVQFVDAFFGARTDGGTFYDLKEFAPKLDEAAARSSIDQVPIVVPTGPFDLVLIDADAGTEVLLAAAALSTLAPAARLVFSGAHHDAIAELIAFGAKNRSVDQIETEQGIGFTVVALG